jgi:prepilin-type N-terminal cleavage/methylation domain-containing protein
MKKTPRKSGFSTVELLVTLIIAAIFLVAGYQLHTITIKDSGETRAKVNASNVAYDYLQRYKSTVTNPCAAQTPLSDQPITVLNLSHVTITVAITCPYSSANSISKITTTVKYNVPQRVITNATYITL